MQLAPKYSDWHRVKRLIEVDRIAVNHDARTVWLVLRWKGEEHRTRFDMPHDEAFDFAQDILAALAAENYDTTAREQAKAVEKIEEQRQRLAAEIAHKEKDKQDLDSQIVKLMAEKAALGQTTQNDSSKSDTYLEAIAGKIS